MHYQNPGEVNDMRSEGDGTDEDLNDARKTSVSTGWVSTGKSEGEGVSNGRDRSTNKRGYKEAANTKDAYKLR